MPVPVRRPSPLPAAAAHPIVLVGGSVLDLLAIHPFADGNGRVARLATTYLLLQAGYGVSRYVSAEQRGRGERWRRLPVQPAEAGLP